MFVYLAGPISAKDGYSIEDNVAAALKVYFDLVRRRIACFCPQLCAGYPSAFSDVEYETWLAYDFAIIDCCTHVLLLPRWDTSSGAVRERAYAIKTGKVITNHAALIAQVTA